MTEIKITLADLGKLSKPLSKLIQVVSQGIGIFYEPTRIRRKAKAEADASLIQVEADIKQRELLQRAVNRLTFQEISRQANIENIIRIAAESLPTTVSEEPVDKDWVSRFFDECKDVSNEDLQELWARILSREVSSPKSCSRKTLAILKDLSLEDAIIFSKFCSLIWSCGDNFFFPYKKKSTVDWQLGKYGVSYAECLHLESLSLIHSKVNVISSTMVNGDILSYFDIDHICYIDPIIPKVEVLCLPLTQPGVELFLVVNAKPNTNFYDDCLTLFSDVYHAYLACPLKKI